MSSLWAVSFQERDTRSNMSGLLRIALVAGRLGKGSYAERGKMRKGNGVPMNVRRA